MTRMLVAGLCLMLTLIVFSVGPAGAGAAPVAKRTFATEVEAVKGCGTDVVVWINRNTGVFHLKDTRWYGKTKDGAYSCRSEVEPAGFHAAKSEK